MNNDIRKVDVIRDPLSRKSCANMNRRDYIGKTSSFDDCGPAYGFGVDARGRYPGCDFDDVEAELSHDWATSRGASILSWNWARHAARDAWNRLSLSN